MTETCQDSAGGEGSLVPWYVLGSVAVVCAAALILIAVLGPAMLDIIHYRTSQSGIWQTQAFDITDLIVLVPLLLAGGVSAFLRRDATQSSC